ncbi:hypothetical protein BJV78DRAFT_745013 [Lactifluus subvellereus]|nr:hypothetical protein BJV78DRAFT_745013 [Lactifluus subvellereus]
MDARALVWTLNALDEDHELEQFVAAIPGYYRSSTVQPPHVALKHLTHHEGLDPLLEARILDPPPASAMEHKRRVQSLGALYCPPGVVARHLHSAVIEPTLFATHPLSMSSEAWAVVVSMSQDTDKDIALARHCVVAVFVATWRYDFAVMPGLGDDVGSLARNLGVPESVIQAWAQQPDSVMSTNLIHLLEDTLDDLCERDALDLLPIGMDVASPSRHKLLYTTQGAVNKFGTARAARRVYGTFDQRGGP